MHSGQDPFFHHPELRDEITDPLESLLPILFDSGSGCEGKGVGDSRMCGTRKKKRETLRTNALEGHSTSDLWVFAYGSLMWDPAIRFTEVRRAHVRDHARRFILKDIYGARGTAEAPG